MNDRDIELMRAAAEEIKSLRRQLDIIAPKAEAYDALRQVLRFVPQPSIGFAPDVVWSIERRLAEGDSNLDVQPEDGVPA